MRSAFLRTVVLGCVCALIGLAQQQLSVDKLVEFINSAIKLKQPDKDVAATLAGIRLTQKLDPRMVEDLQGRGAGPKTVAALNKLAEESANLTPAHAAAVTAIVAQVVAGSLDRRAAGAQIDALLTPVEQKAVLAASDKSRAAMRAAMMAAGGRPPDAGPPPPPGPGGPPPGAGPPPPGGGRFGPPSAGRYLLMVSMSREQMRSLMPRARSTSAP